MSFFHVTARVLYRCFSRQVAAWRSSAAHEYTRAAKQSSAPNTIKVVNMFTAKIRAKRNLLSSFQHCFNSIARKLPLFWHA